MPSLNFALISLIVGISLGIGGYIYGRHEQSKLDSAAAYQAEVKHKDREDKLIADLDKEKAKTHIVYKTREKIIREAKDPSKCADTAIAPAIRSQLR